MRIKTNNPWQTLLALITGATAMKPNALLKLAAIASSVLLMAGFVSYRAGAFGWLSDTSTRSVDAEGDPTLERNPVDDPSSDSATQAERTIMSSSKSIMLAPSAPTSTTVTLGANEYKIELPSPNPAEAQPPAPPDPPPPKATERERTLLPGSKAPIPVVGRKPKP
jgi:hypothetical protein